MNIGLYARKSKATDKGESIDNQLTMCQSFVSAMYPGQEHTFLVYKDEGFSGKNTRRPDFSRMMFDVKAGRIDCVVVYRLDRISRNIIDFMTIIEKLNKRNVSFVSVNEKFDTGTPMGRAMMNITAVFAELERETIAERVRDNMLMLSQTGRWLGGKAPLGFDSERMPGDKALGTKAKSRLKRNNEQMAAVHKIYDLYEELGSFHAVRKYLFEHNYEVRGRKTCTDSLIKGVLQNPTYCIADEDALDYFQNLGATLPDNAMELFDGKHGLMPYNRHQAKGDTIVSRDEDEWMIAVGEHEGEISGARWVRIQRRMEENVKRFDCFSSATNNYALLSGMLVCARCGKRMYTKPQNKKGRKGSASSFFYVCETQKKYTSKACPCKAVRGDRIDVAFKNFFLQMADPKEAIAEAMKHVKSRSSARNQETRIATLESRIRDLEKRRNGLFSVIGSLVSEGKEMPEDMKQLVIDLGQQIAMLNGEKDSCREEISKEQQREATLREYNNLIEHWADEVNKLPIPMLRDKLKQFIDRVEWDGENLSVFWKGA